MGPDTFQIESLHSVFGGTLRSSPLKDSFTLTSFVSDDDDRILVDPSLRGLIQSERPEKGRIVFAPASFECAGPRKDIFWDPPQLKVAIVTCGGLAPGLNNVLQSLVQTLERYGTQTIYGIPYGFLGFSHDSTSKKFRFGWRRLDQLSVENLDNEAGSILGTSRGNSDMKHVVDALMLRDINVLFTAGGDGTMAATQAIFNEITKRKLPIAVVGIPKTIDNDIPWVSRTFGFETAVEKAVEALKAAQTEAKAVFNGIGLVRIMGRHSGSLTATAAASVSGIDAVIVPEIPLILEGENGFLNFLSRRLIEKGHATIAVAEGAGQELIPEPDAGKDASGNKKLKNIGLFLQSTIGAHFKKLKMEHSIKYIDPSYLVRAQNTSASDALFCKNLAQSAVHAAMAGKTGCLIGYAHGEFTHVPLRALTLGKKRLDTDSSLWLSVLASTGQPSQWSEGAQESK